MMEAGNVEPFMQDAAGSSARHAESWRPWRMDRGERMHGGRGSRVCARVINSHVRPPL